MSFKKKQYRVLGDDYVSVINIITFENKPFLILFKSNDVEFFEYSQNTNTINNIIHKIFQHIEDRRTCNLVVYLHNLMVGGSLILNYFDTNFYYLEPKSFLMKDNTIYGFKLYDLKNNSISFKCSFKMTNLNLKDFTKIILNKNFPVCEISIGDILKKPYINIASSEHINISKKDFTLQLLPSLDSITLKDLLISTAKLDISLLHNSLCTYFTEIKNHFKISIFSNKHVYSLSSLSLMIFSKYYDYCNIEKFLNKYVDRAIRSGYHGGRVEVFGNPESNKIYYYDYSGFYASIMLSDKMPISKPKFLDTVDVIDQPGFYYVDVKSQMDLPVLPNFSTDLDKLIFPNGVFSGWY
jgi:hypothetical protein